MDHVELSAAAKSIRALITDREQHLRVRALSLGDDKLLQELYAYLGREVYEKSRVVVSKPHRGGGKYEFAMLEFTMEFKNMTADQMKTSSEVFGFKNARIVAAPRKRLHEKLNNAQANVLVFMRHGWKYLPVIVDGKPEDVFKLCSADGEHTGLRAWRNSHTMSRFDGLVPQYCQDLTEAWTLLQDCRGDIVDWESAARTSRDSAARSIVLWYLDSTVPADGLEWELIETPVVRLKK